MKFVEEKREKKDLYYIVACQLFFLTVSAKINKL